MLGLIRPRDVINLPSWAPLPESVRAGFRLILSLSQETHPH
jgi:hypothetical protein